MIPETVSIDDLILRLPGLERDAARKLGEDVARILARELPSLHVLPEGLSLRLRVPSTARADDLAAALAEQILEALR